jgi:hypothetical protein
VPLWRWPCSRRRCAGGRRGERARAGPPLRRLRDRVRGAAARRVVPRLGGRSAVVHARLEPGAHVHELSKPVSPAGWAGAYVELLSFGLFLAFLVWACARLGGGLLGAIARAAGLGYATLSVTALGVMDALAYRAGHGVGAQVGTALANVSSALFVASWLLAAFFLLAAGPAALASGRRVLGWSATAVAALTLIGTPALLEHGGQAGYFLWLGWIVYASVSLARGAPAREAAAVATSRGYVPSPR